MNNNQKVSVGISAYNEEANISQLLQSLLAQKEKNYTLKEIIVVADGCTDHTVLEVKKIKDKRVTLINDRQRKGKSARLNEILQTFSGDVLVLMDADIVINDKQFFDRFITKVNFSKAGVAAPNYSALPATNFFEKCLHISLDVQVDLRKKWHRGRNYLSFKGACMALGRDFARSISLPRNLVNNDAYIYFKAVEKGYTPAYIPTAYIHYKTPTNFKDHLAQTSRYQASESELMKFVHISPDEYHIPKSLYYFTTVKYLLKKPIPMLGYLSIRAASKIWKKKRVKSRWVIASSTKAFSAS